MIRNAWLFGDDLGDLVYFFGTGKDGFGLYRTSVGWLSFENAEKISDTLTDFLVIKILAYRNCIVVCTSKNLHYKVRELLQGKNRDEIFELPLVYGQTIHYVPNDNYTEDARISLNYECQYLFGRDILPLTGLTGFDNSLSFDENGATSTKAVYIAKDNQKIIGAAGAAESSTDGGKQMRLCTVLG